MKVIESIRYNRTGEVNDAKLYDGEDMVTAISTVIQFMDATREETRRNLFTTTAVRIEF